MPLSHKFRRCMLIVLAVLLSLAGLGIYWGSRHIAPYAIVRPSRVTQEERQRLRAQFRPMEEAMQLDTFTVRSQDGLALRALLCQPRETTKVQGVLVVLHGIGNCKESFIPFASECTRLGYACLLPDLRAHGESEGLNCTFGWYEKEDIKLFVNALKEVFDKNLPLGIYGYSLGGAVALQAMEHDSRIDFGIIESTFSSVNEIIPEYQARLMHFRWPWLSRVALRRAGEIAAFPPNEVHPAQSASRICRPMLMAHGTADTYIPIAHGEKNFAALTCPGQWYPIPGGTHPDLNAGGGLEPYLHIRRSFLLAQRLQQEGRWQ